MKARSGIGTKFQLSSSDEAAVAGHVPLGIDTRLQVCLIIQRCGLPWPEWLLCPVCASGL